MVLPADNSAPLSVHWAFVVQFQSDTAVEQGYLTGRVEHVASGQSTALQSLETLLAFIVQVLTPWPKSARDGDRIGVKHYGRLYTITHYRVSYHGADTLLTVLCRGIVALLNTVSGAAAYHGLCARGRVRYH